MKMRFYAIATGQNQANLPPILALAPENPLKTRPEVVWLETTRARVERWAHGSSEVLEKLGFRCRSLPLPDSVMHSPQKLCEKILDDIGENPQFETVLVLNGGQKPQAMGIERAWSKQPFRIAYLDTDPACTLLELDSEGNEFTGRPIAERLPCERSLKLEQWLSINRFKFWKKSEPAPQRIWPDLPAPSSLLGNLLGDVEYRRAVFGVHKFIRRTGDESDSTLRVIPESLQSSPEFVKAWMKIIEDCWEHNGGQNTQPKGPLYERMQSFFRHRLKPAYPDDWMDLAPAIAEQLKRDGWLHGDMANGRVTRQNMSTGGSLGTGFEAAVAARLLRYFDSHDTSSIVEVWRNVSVIPEEAQDATDRFVEFDIVIVLKNASVLALECKCRPIESKENFARLAKLKQAGGEAVRQVFAFPFFPEFVKGPAFEYCEGLLRDAQRLTLLNPRSFGILPFTPPGHPEDFHHSLEGISTPVRPFESALERFLPARVSSETAGFP